MLLPDDPRLQAALAILREENAWTLEQQVSLCEVEAPPFHEAARAEEFRRRLAVLGLSEARLDAVGNAIATRPGVEPRPSVVLSAHLDTVFPPGTDVRVRRDGGRLSAPGIGDNARGLAAVLAVVRAFERAGVRTQGTLHVVGTVGEEGLGNLRGVRNLFEVVLPGEVDYFLSIDGAGTAVISRGVGSRRFRATYSGPGGHSYGAFGTPNPAHALGRAIARIADLQVPAKPKTTFSVSILSGGTAVNAIPATASLHLDLRSEATDALDALEAEARAALDAGLAAENARWPQASVQLTLAVETLGIRPAGTQPDSLPIIRVVQEAKKALGQEPGETRAAGTDSNLPIHLGIPAVTLGAGGRSERGHSLEEWYEDGDDGYLGPQHVALVVAALAGLR